MREMVDLFLILRKDRVEQERAWWADPTLSPEAACRRALFGLGGVRDTHQWIFSAAELEAMAEQVALHSATLAAAKDFEDLYRRIEVALGLRRDRKPLLVYDIAHRLGHRIGREPEQVYLHAGPEKGAEALKPGLGRPRRRPLSDFPKSIRTRLAPAQAEDFLCLAAKALRADLWD
ncbi:MULTISPECIES: hypothetical protein [unclassified Caulobacter]|uniref:hypothetical protein n=1 Tax=unclassified Caulobacter TaxID=2648921 RepID=UPI0012E35218|nr:MULTISPECIES: hypothetical protein [unclassified Caulobacter]